jgi:uncharacterized integral membrane protein
MIRKMIRKLASALLLGTVAVLLISLAVANRRTVTVALDPFDEADPALAFSLPLYQLMFLLLIGGAVIGGCAAWLRQSKWRQRARRAEAEAGALRSRSDNRAGSESAARAAVTPRLVIPPPAA